MIILLRELPDILEVDKKEKDSSIPHVILWNNMKEKHRISGEKWAKKKAAERASGIYR